MSEHRSSSAQISVKLHPFSGIRVGYSRMKLPFVDGVSNHASSHEVPREIFAKRRKDAWLAEKVKKSSFLS